MNTIQSELEQVSEALRDMLAAGVFTQKFTPEETYDATMELKDTDTLHVDVVPVRSEAERNTRGSIAWQSVLDIGIRFRFGTEHQDSATGAILNRHIHGLLYLEQEISQFLLNTPRLPSYDDAVLVEGPVIRVGWVPKHMTSLRQFTGIIRVTYHTETEIP